MSVQCEVKNYRFLQEKLEDMKKTVGRPFSLAQLSVLVAICADINFDANDL